MNWAKILILVWFGIGLLISANEHGKEKEGYYNFWSSALAAALFMTLLYLAGFFE